MSTSATEGNARDNPTGSHAPTQTSANMGLMVSGHSDAAESILGDMAKWSTAIARDHRQGRRWFILALPQPDPQAAGPGSPDGWPAVHWEYLLDQLRAFGAGVAYLIGGVETDPAIPAVHALCGITLHVVYRISTPAEFSALVSAADLVIALDGFSLITAGQLDRPTVALVTDYRKRLVYENVPNLSPAHVWLTGMDQNAPQSCWCHGQKRKDPTCEAVGCQFEEMRLRQPRLVLGAIEQVLRKVVVDTVEI